MNTTMDQRRHVIMHTHHQARVIHVILFVMMPAHSVADSIRFVVSAIVKRSSSDQDVKRRSVQIAMECSTLVRVAIHAMDVVLVTSTQENVDVDIHTVVFRVSLKHVLMIAWTVATATRTLVIAHVVMMSMVILFLDHLVNSELAPMIAPVVESVIVTMESASVRTVIQESNARKQHAVRMTTCTTIT